MVPLLDWVSISRTSLADIHSQIAATKLRQMKQQEHAGALPAAEFLSCYIWCSR